MNSPTSSVIDAEPAAASKTNPFPGLRPFREDEEYLFFGRESQVDAMVNGLAATRFLAVVGTSGSGKSSLVNSGLRPALHGGLMAHAGTTWRMAQFRPGTDPVRAMAGALAMDGLLFHDDAKGGLTLVEIIDTTLRMSRLGLIDIYEQARVGEDVNLLVVVDQFEELIRYRQIRTGQQDTVYGGNEPAIAFVNLLLEAKEQTAYPIFVVLTMRSDFLGDCAQFPGLTEAINGGQFLVPRMTRDERRAAIAGPIGVGGAEIEPVLLTRLVNDVGDDPDQLSILQHALNRTWARWQEQDGGAGPLGLAHYEAIGTMTRALNQHAERAYAELRTSREQQLCEKIFKALTDKATDPRGVRRPTTLRALSELADASAAEAAAVIEVFRKPSRSFLMPPAGEALEPETVIDISHESLMRVWQRLDTWADEEAQSARTYRRVADSAALHAGGKAGLWRDPDLQLALDWRDQTQPNEAWGSRYHPGFAPAMRFLTESSDAREAERRATRRRLIGTGGILIALVAVFAALAAWALSQRAEAREQAQAARAGALFAKARELEANAIVQLGRDPELGLLLAARAARMAPSAATHDVLRRTLRESRVREVVRLDSRVSDLVALRGGGLAAVIDRGAVRLMKGGRPGRHVVPPQQGATTSLSGDLALTVRRGMLVVRRLPGGNVIATVPVPSGTRFTSAGPLARRFIVAGKRGAEVLGADGQVLAELPHPARVQRAEFSPNGKLIATAGADGDAILWSEFGARLHTLPGSNQSRMFDVAFSPLSRQVVTASSDGTARVWDVQTGRRKSIMPLHGNQVRRARFGGNEDVVLTASRDGTARTWKVATGGPRAVFAGHEGMVTAAVFMPRDQLATASEDGTVRTWVAQAQPRLVPARSTPAPRSGRDDRASVMGSVVILRVFGREVVLEGHRGDVLSVEFSPDGTRVVTASIDGDARIWDARTGKPRRILRGHFGTVFDASFSPDGRWVVTGGPSTAGVWDAKTGERIYFLQGHGGPVRAAEFSSPTRIVTTGDDGVRKYQCDICGDLKSLLALAERRLASTGRG